MRHASLEADIRGVSEDLGEYVEASTNLHAYRAIVSMELALKRALDTVRREGDRLRPLADSEWTHTP